MTDIKEAKGSFRFYTRLILSELTGERASSLPELLELIKTVPDASIYHHTHRYLQQHQYLSPEPPNDFAYWVGAAIGEDELAERLASIDTVRFTTIPELRTELVRTIEEYLQKDADAGKRVVHEGEEFHFIKAVSFIMPTNYAANNLAEFVETLERITIDSIYFHMFESRLRLKRGNNDFSFWIETSLGENKIANKIAKLDPYTYTLEDLRKTIIDIIKKRLAH